jgi:NADH dehydrogenase
MSTTAVDGVLVVGGGYAGVHTARSVIRAGRPACVVDPTGRHDLVTRLAAVAGGTSPERDASIPLSEFTDHVIVGWASQVDDGVVTLADGRTYSADAVVVTAGAVSSTPPIPGIEHARPLRTAEHAVQLRAEIAEATSVVIVGGGATGVQLAGSIGVAHRSTDVVVIDGAGRLLETMQPEIGADAWRILRDRGVSVRVGENVDEIGEESVSVGGDEIAGLVVWAGGFDPRADRLGMPVTDSGRIAVDRCLRVDGWKSTLAAGDIAGHLDRDGDEFAMSAQIAVQAGDAAGRNAIRMLDGRDLEPAHLEHRGWVLDLSGGRGLAEVGPIALSAPFLDLVPPLLHWGIDVKHLVETRGLAGLLDRPR